MIELNKRFKLTTPAGMLSIAGIDAVCMFIKQQDLQSPLWKESNSGLTQTELPPLPEDWNWTWVVQRGTYAGTMPKRISNFYYKVHGLNCPQAFLTAVGNLARQHSESEREYDFEFVDRFDWRGGDFGDYGSCLFGSRSEGRRLMEAHGCKAVRFYDEDGKGKGRAWLYSLQPDLHLVWNGYGFVADSTLVIARVLASHLSMSYKRIWLTNNGDEGGLVWINAGRGYLIGSTDALSRYDRYDLEIGTEDSEDHCHSCERVIDEDSTYIGADDEMYCEHCYYEEFAECDHCGHTHWRENTTYIYNTGAVCDNCLDRYYRRCDNCGEFVPEQEIEATEEGDYCRNCFDDLATDETTDK